ncbi:unnamed protein product [Danaus chrysippus]|uniref:(African queen) hypothetical protein n=1 Tax=Danaus chrysippus TaxID=151541 RepID=A0A8J2QC98_9NEOP|nr:unnamed protein product [Danaus chrysippus]
MLSVSERIPLARPTVAGRAILSADGVLVGKGRWLRCCCVASHWAEPRQGTSLRCAYCGAQRIAVQSSARLRRDRDHTTLLRNTDRHMAHNFR